MESSIKPKSIQPKRLIHIDSKIAIKAFTGILSVFSAVFILLVPIFSRFDKQLLDSVKLTGINILSSFGSEKLIYVALGNTYDIYIPFIMRGLVLAVLSLSTISLLFILFIKQSHRIVGILNLVSASLIFIYFVSTILFGGITAKDFSGEHVALYKLFDYGSGLVLSAFSAAGAFVTGFLIKEEHLPQIKRFWFMYALLAIPMLLLVIFSLYPILLQTVLSFKEYRFTDGVWGSDWVGFKQFAKIFTDPNMARIILNTIKISLLRLLFNMIPPILLALMIFEIRNRFFKAAIQTITYVPHFFSWVIIFGIVFSFMSPSGIVNNVLQSLGKNTTDFMTNDKYFIPILIVSELWKELGWGTILYLAALSSVNTELFDASAVDGAGPFRKLWYITLPSISSIIVFLFIMAIGNLLKGAGTEQILLFANNAVMKKAEVIDTWVYWQGLGNYQYSLGAAVSFVQSFIGIIMVLSANKLSVKLVGRGLW